MPSTGLPSSALGKRVRYCKHCIEQSGKRQAIGPDHFWTCPATSALAPKRARLYHRRGANATPTLPLYRSIDVAGPLPASPSSRIEDETMSIFSSGDLTDLVDEVASADIAQPVQSRGADDDPERTLLDGNAEQRLTSSTPAIIIPRRYTIYPTCDAASQTTNHECATNQTAGALVTGETSDEKAPSSIGSVSHSVFHYKNTSENLQLDPPRVLESKGAQTVHNLFQKCQQGIQTDSAGMSAKDALLRVLSRIPSLSTAPQSDYAALSASEFDNEHKARIEAEKEWQRKMEETKLEHAALIKMCMEKLAPL